MPCSLTHALSMCDRCPSISKPVGLTLLVVNTGVKHALGNSAYADRVRDCRRAAKELGVAALRDVARRPWMPP